MLASVGRIVVHREAIEVHVAPGVADKPGFSIVLPERIRAEKNELVISTPIRCHVRGGKTSLIQVSASGPRKRPDRILIAGLKRAHAELSKRGIDMTRRRPLLDNARGLEDPYLRKLVNLAFLAPDLQQAILEGRQPIGMTLSILMSSDLPSEWAAQRKLLGFQL